ncbi:MAG: DUF11 domain-containing protein [Acidobacteria bacterium]|nr:DUF11 domain-containing protein [Acidobacteriota bacterium]
MPVALPIVGPNVPPGSVNAGGYIRYDVPFGNAGPSDAVRVVLTDVVPGNTAFVGALATGGAFVPATQPPLFPFTFTIQATDTDGIAPLGPNVNLTCTVAGAPGSQAITCTPFGNGMLVPRIQTGIYPPDIPDSRHPLSRSTSRSGGGTIVANPANITSTRMVTPGTADLNPGNNTSPPTQTVVIAPIEPVDQQDRSIGGNGGAQPESDGTNRTCDTSERRDHNGDGSPARHVPDLSRDGDKQRPVGCVQHPSDRCCLRVFETPPGPCAWSQVHLGESGASFGSHLHLCGADRRQPVEQPAGQRWFTRLYRSAALGQCAEQRGCDRHHGLH